MVKLLKKRSWACNSHGNSPPSGANSSTNHAATLCQIRIRWVSDMCEIAAKNNFYPIYISSEKPRYFKKILNFIKSINNFWPNIRKNYPRVASEEILSGMYHVVFKKVK